ncbi:MAG: hypothetical protein EAZ85_12420 [Bacteroidetes bacterium]|nr:MAG: hypothetical protein EAZ85_12420 [Bacteroidota bacterium]
MTSITIKIVTIFFSSQIFFGKCSTFFIFFKANQKKVPKNIILVLFKTEIKNQSKIILFILFY